MNIEDLRSKASALPVKARELPRRAAEYQRAQIDYAREFWTAARHVARQYPKATRVIVALELIGAWVVVNFIVHLIIEAPKDKLLEAVVKIIIP